MERPRLAIGAPARDRVRQILSGVAILGCALLLIGLIQAIVDAPRQPTLAQVPLPNIEVRAKFANLAPGGQTSGFAVAPDGSLAVVDRGRERVVRLDANAAPLTEWGPRFEPDADAGDLGGIAATANDWYLLDRGRERILKLDASGHATRTIDLKPLATYGPTGLATDARGDVYLADTGGNRVLEFSSGGALIRTIGSPGDGPGQLKQPTAVSFGPDGAMYVSNLENKRIARWDVQLQPTNAWPLSNPSWGVGVDGLGRVFAPDPDRRLVRMFGPQGDLLAEIEGVGVEFPTQLGLSPDSGTLWVLGSDGLARVDLAPYRQIVPTGRSGQAPLQLAFVVGALLVLASTGPLALRSIATRRGRPRLAPRPAPTPGPQPTPSPPPTPTPRASLSRRARLLLTVGTALFGVGLLGVVLTQLSLAGPTGKADPWFRLIVEVVSGLLSAVGCVLSARVLPFAWVTTDWPARAAIPQALVLRGPRLVVAIVAVALALLAGGIWCLGRFETPSATRGALLWLVALVLAGLACSRIFSGVRFSRPSAMALIPLLLFIVAFVPRIWQVADLPYGMWFDEAQGALEVRRVVQQGTYTPILNTYGKDTSGFFYLMPALSLVLGDGVLAARAAAALVGALTPIATYLLGRELFGWRVGLAAGALLAVMRWHINFSRLGFNPISLPLCAVVAFWLLARSVRTRRWSDIALAGLALGIGLHAYTGFRGMPFVALFSLVYAAVVFRWTPATLIPRFGTYLIGVVLVGLPVLIFAVQDPITFNGRTAQTLILAQPVSDAEKLRQIGETLQRHLLMFNVSGDMNGRHNLPGAPMLDPLTSILVVFGLGWLVLRLRDWRTITLLAWIAVAMSGGILTLAFEAPQGVRTFGITPVLAVLGGLGLVATLDRLAALVSLPRTVYAWRPGLLAGGLAALVVAWIGFTNIDTFFNRQMQDAEVFASFSTRETVPARTALEGRGRYEGILASTTMVPSVDAAYLVPDLQSTMRQFDPAGDLPYRGQGPGWIMLETEHDQALADQVARMYPDATREPVRPPSGGKAVVEAFRLEPDVLAAHRGLQVTNHGADATWRGAIALDATGEYSFRVPAGFQLRLDDALIPLAADVRGVRVRLVRGNHAVHISGPVEGGTESVLEWRNPGATNWEPAPARLLFSSPPGGLGLSLTLSPSSDLAGQPLEEYVDPVIAHYFHVSPFARLHQDLQIWTAEWVGQLDAPATGSYSFTFDHSQVAAVWLDGQLILGNLNGQADTRNTTLQVTAGRHDIRLRFEKHAEASPWITLYWTPPGMPQSVVPGSALFAPPPEVLGPAQ